LYFAGLRPSYGQTLPLLVVARAVVGVILLPGLLFLLVRGRTRDSILVILFSLPVFIGPTQDRYYLPILPILFYYGVLAYSAAWRRVVVREVKAANQSTR